MAARGRPVDDENEITRIRVVTQTSQITRGGPPAKNLATRWIAFVEAAQNGTADQAKEAYQRFLLELANMELLGRKLAASQAASKRELETYEQQKQQLVQDIAQANEVIEAKKRELGEARIWRQQQEEYEVLRKQITEVQPRHETQQQIDAVNREIDSIKQAIQRQQSTYEVIAKKCAAVRHQVEDLLNSFPRADGAVAADADGAQPMQVDA